MQESSPLQAVVIVQVKLAMRSVPMPGDAPSVPKPFLTFTCRGPNLNMVQDLPISKPHLPARAPPARSLSHHAGSTNLDIQACRPPYADSALLIGKFERKI